jgi:hypothetical protein
MTLEPKSTDDEPASKPVDDAPSKPSDETEPAIALPSPIDASSAAGSDPPTSAPYVVSSAPYVPSRAQTVSPNARLIPNRSLDDSDFGWGDPGDSNDDRLVDERPPHWSES